LGEEVEKYQSEEDEVAENVEAGDFYPVNGVPVFKDGE
jgi:hypothetical protein